jgi:putative tricarboxylic transport membrane protein
MRKYDTLSGLFLLVVSVAILLGSLPLQVGSFTAPGSGFFPLLTGVVLGLFSLLILAQARGERAEPIRFWAPAANRKGIYLSFVLILVYALLLERLGFIVSTTLFFVLFSRYVSGHRWGTAVFFALVTSLATYFLFNLLLHAPLPQGVLGRLF